ncbi:MAG: non-homologous end-joining DNA ligase [Candidatus Nanoarchaeia archaeon]
MYNQKIKPMLAYSGKKDDLKKKEFYFEPKIDGTRALLYKYKNNIQILNRRQNWISFRYPEIIADAKKIKGDFILDGEICVLNEKGLPDFSKLQSREQITNFLKIKFLAKSFPVTYYVFDILFLNEKDLTHLPLFKRKKILEKVVKDSKCIKKILFNKNGIILWRSVKNIGLEGVMAKKIDSKYEIGRRSENWLKIKNVKTTDCIICGWSTGKREFASLILGQYKDSNLIYVGNVGTGFDKSLLKTIYSKIRKLKIKNCPFKEIPKIKGKVFWMKPELIVEVKYLEYTKRHHLRVPSFVRFRYDKTPKECILEL